VSHDRAFLERTTQRCFWLESRRVRRLDKGFKDFEPWADAILEQEAEIARRADKQLGREEHWLQRGCHGAPGAQRGPSPSPHGDARSQARPDG
jgi:ATP-binding cassette subfamily F protein uup